MSDRVKQSASYIVSNEILHQTKEFTVEDIIEKVKIQLMPILKTIGNIKKFIENKVNSLCELGLVSGTGIFYYVLS